MIQADKQGTSHRYIWTGNPKYGLLFLEKENPSHICFCFPPRHLVYENVGHITAGSSSRESLGSSDKSFRVLNSFRVEEQRIFFLSPSTF